jgi:NAD(P)-dependent dehydrogenase (short-subunit alcohol dehydrogenase family)
MAILITGASGGLGTTVYQAFAATGAKVIGAARSGSDLDVDLSTAEGAQSMVDQVLKQGPLDALGAPGRTFAGRLDRRDRRQNLGHADERQPARGVLAMRASLKPMLAQKHGRIVVIGARAAIETMPNFSAYAVSKAGVVALVRNVAAEVRDHGITCNAVLPSTIDTEVNRKAMPNATIRNGSRRSPSRALGVAGFRCGERCERSGDSNLWPSLKN